MRVKIEVGQIWHAIHGNYSIEITKVAGGYASSTDEDGTPGAFTDVDRYGFAELDENHWRLISSSPLTPNHSNSSRECPCGIFRGDCEYHR